MKRKLVSLVMMMAILNGVLFAGGQQESTTDLSTGPVVLSFPDMRTGGDISAPVYDEIRARFNEKFEGIYRIEVEPIPDGAAYAEKLKILYATNELPPLIAFGHDPVLADMIIQDGKALDLKPYIDASPEWKENLIDSSVAYNTRDGKIVGAPSTEDAFIGIFYNKELFAKAGIKEFPKTWDAFWDACDTLQASGITPIALHTSNRGWSGMLMMTAAMAGLSKDGEAFMQEVYPSDFNQPFVAEAAGYLKKFFSYAVPESVGGTFAQSSTAFMNGENAIFANGPWSVKDFNNRDKSPEGFNEKVGYALYPGDVAITGVSLGWGIAADAPKEVQEGLIEWLKFCASPEIIRLKCKELGYVSPTVPLTEEDEEALDPILKEYNELIYNDLKVTPSRYLHVWDSVVTSELIPQNVPLLAMGDMTPEEFCAVLEEGAKQFQRSQQ